MPEGEFTLRRRPIGIIIATTSFSTCVERRSRSDLYVFLSVGVSATALLLVEPGARAGYCYQYTQVQHYSDAATGRASHGHHPALAGFYVTNETNQPGTSGTYAYREYWGLSERRARGAGNRARRIAHDCRARCRTTSRRQTQLSHAIRRRTRPTCAGNRIALCRQQRQHHHDRRQQPPGRHRCSRPDLWVGTFYGAHRAHADHRLSEPAQGCRPSADGAGR